MDPLKISIRKPPWGRTPQLPLYPAEDPFVKGYRRAAAGRTEFAVFASRVKDLEARVNAIPRLSCLRPEYSLYAEYVEDQTFQIRFGNRRTFRFDATQDGSALLVETGPRLVYSLGADGTVAIMLYGARSNAIRAREDIIYLAIGRFGYTTLLDRLDRDLKTLAAYGHATSIDGTPTFGEWARVLWLRKLHPHTTEEGFQEARLGAGAVGRFMGKTILTASLNALLRPIFLILVIWWLATYQADLAELLPGNTLR